MRATRVGSGWMLGLLIVYVGSAAIVLLAPVSFSGIVHAIAGWLAVNLGLDWFGSGWIEFSANILLFAPLGLLLALLIGRFWWAVLTAVTLSAAAEIIQIVIPRREPTLRDVLANTLGAVLGASVVGLFRRLRPGRPNSAQSLDDAATETDRIVQTGAPVEDAEH